MAENDSTVTDHSTLMSKRAELAATAAWSVTTLCDELLEQVGKVGMLDPPQGRAVLTIGAIAVRARELAEVAALCLDEDEEHKPLAELERAVFHG
jgi:hypothetical protein